MLDIIRNADVDEARIRVALILRPPNILVMGNCVDGLAAFFEQQGIKGRLLIFLAVHQIMHGVTAGFQAAHIANAKLIHQTDGQRVGGIDQIGALIECQAEMRMTFLARRHPASRSFFSFQYEAGQAGLVKPIGRIKPRHAGTNNDNTIGCWGSGAVNHDQ